MLARRVGACSCSDLRWKLSDRAVCLARATFCDSQVTTPPIASAPASIGACQAASQPGRGRGESTSDFAPEGSSCGTRACCTTPDLLGQAHLCLVTFPSMVWTSPSSHSRQYFSAVVTHSGYCRRYINAL